MKIINCVDFLLPLSHFLFESLPKKFPEGILVTSGLQLLRHQWQRISEIQPNAQILINSSRYSRGKKIRRCQV